MAFLHGRVGLWIVAAAISASLCGVANAQLRSDGSLGAPARNSGAGSGINGAAGANQGGPGAEGGAASADFDSLIDLITSTVEVESWAENGTGEGDIQPFFNGVYVDAAGALRMRRGGAGATLASVRAVGAPAAHDVTAATVKAQPRATSRTASAMRYVSLPRLEAAIADCQRRHAAFAPEMLTLAGLQRVSFVLVYPETGDLVVAGPAGDWQTMPTGAIVSVETGRPIVRLDDLLTLWRQQHAEKGAAFGCSIIPRQEALARTQEFLAATAVQPLEPGARRKWLAGLRDNLGEQDVEYYNIDPDTRVAGLLLAADYHMKLVGMGLAEGVPGVKSYLATVRVGKGGQLPPMSILRWWFAMAASEVEASPEHDAFALVQRCVEVLSENEMLAARGERVHTGESDPLNRQFADSFTQHFAALAEKYPVYGELERVFELSLALALIEREGLTEKVAWTPTLWLDAGRLKLPKVTAPRAVETVINHRVVGGRHVIAGVSGGVWMDGGKSLRIAEAQAPAKKTLASVRSDAAASTADGVQRWWWD